MKDKYIFAVSYNGKSKKYEIKNILSIYGTMKKIYKVIVYLFSKLFQLNLKRNLHPVSVQITNHSCNSCRYFVHVFNNFPKLIQD